MFGVLASRLAGLRARYAEPHRVYHTQAHIDAMLAGLSGLGDAVAHGATLELATWYHDAVYDPAATDNEARSADLLRAELAGVADPTLLEHAGLFVRATADHAIPADTPPELRAELALFLDLDMGVLAAAPAAYDAYERGIAAEYVPVHGLDAFRAGRARFLRTMLARPRLFLSDRFHAECDGAARRNLRAALAGLDP